MKSFSKIILFNLITAIISCADPQHNKHFKRLKIWEDIQIAAKENKIEYLLSQDIFFHQRKQKCVSDLLQAIRTNRGFDDCREYFFPNAER